MMFKSVLLLALLVTAGLLSCKGPVKGKNGVVYNSAQEYNDFIFNRQTELARDMLAIGQVMEANPDSAMAMAERLIVKADKSIADIAGMPDYKGDTILRNASVNSFRFYRGLCENEYKEVINIRKKGDKITEADINRIDEIVENITKREEPLDKVLQKAQKDFAKANNMGIKPNPVQKELDKAGE
jgi:hypothetical protein